MLIPEVRLRPAVSQVRDVRGGLDGVGQGLDIDTRSDVGLDGVGVCPLLRCIRAARRVARRAVSHATLATV